MVLAYHLVFTAYGFWLPNDPRGSWSDFVRSWELFLAAGPATKITTHRSVAHTPHNNAQRHAAKSALRYPPVIFNDQQLTTIADGFQTAVTRSHFTIHACSILPTHVHAVIKRHTYDIEKVMNQLKGQASTALTNANLHPFQNTILPSGQRHSPWTEEGWDVYLNTPAEIHRSIHYVQQNPAKENLPPQPWPFLTPTGNTCV
jgi:REP element-mobilizing transposase RayT